MAQTWREGRITPTTRDHEGTKNPRWHGGTHLTHQGYRCVWAPEHPFAIRGKVLEHRLVVETVIGRYLTSSEVVHHKNGVKDDNRPENLELMSVSKHNQEHDPDRPRGPDGRYI